MFNTFSHNIRQAWIAVELPNEIVSEVVWLKMMHCLLVVTDKKEICSIFLLQLVDLSTKCHNFWYLQVTWMHLQLISCSFAPQGNELYILSSMLRNILQEWIYLYIENRRKQVALPDI